MTWRPDLCHGEFDFAAEHIVDVLPASINQVVNHTNAGAETGEMAHQPGADESGAAGDEETVIRQCGRSPTIGSKIRSDHSTNSDAGVR